MKKRKRLFIFSFALLCCLFISGADGKTTAQSTFAFTAEYRRFLAARGNENSFFIQENADGYQFTLENGRLCVLGTDDAEVWRSKDEWYVDSFRLGDVNRDGILDIVFVVWKSYSFGAEHPARSANDDTAVRCHLFVYSIKDDRVKPLWCSSNLPRPVYSFELDTDGAQTPTLSGVRLVTREGSYTEDYRITESSGYVYAWSGWGFSNEAYKN